MDTSRVENEIAKAKAGATMLDLLGCELTNIPPQVFEFVHLKKLWLGVNNLTSIAEDISALTNLTHLILYYNQLTTLPNTISALTNLQRLYISNNKLTTLPEGITALSLLEYLYLHNNQLVHIPQDICSLSNLTYLTLNNNPTLTYPPYTIIGNENRNVVTEVQQYLSTHGNVYTRAGRRQHMWKQIRLMYIGHKDTNCTTSFNMIDREVIAKIEYFVLCEPYLPSGLLEEGAEQQS